MSSVNKVLLIGHCCADPEIRSTQSGKQVANFRLATNQSWRDRETGERREKAEFHTIVVFNEGLVKVIEQYVKKGLRLFLEGSLQTRSWEDQSGNKRYATEVALQGYSASLVMLDSPSSDKASGSGSDEYREASGVGAQRTMAEELDDEVAF